MTYAKSLSVTQRSEIDEEIARLKAQLEEQIPEIDEPPVIERKDHTNVLVISTIVIAVVGVLAVVAIFSLRPDKDNSAIIATLMGFLVPLMTALLAAAVQQVHAAVNSRLTQLLKVTAAKSHAEGMLAQRRLAKEAEENLLMEAQQQRLHPGKRKS